MIELHLGSKFEHIFGVNFRLSYVTKESNFLLRENESAWSLEFDDVDPERVDDG